jgi:hypothetical protein
MVMAVWSRYLTKMSPIDYSMNVLIDVIVGREQVL